MFYGRLYDCLQAHTSAPQWIPPANTSLWLDEGACTGFTPPACSSVPAWSGNSVPYSTGNAVNYEGSIYICIQPNTSQPGWDPVDAADLWSDQGACQ